MNYNDIKGMTNEEAAAYLGPLTNSYVPCAELENLLGYAGKAKRNAVTGAWEGSLIDFMQSNVVPALCDGLLELFSHLNKPRSVGCDTNEQPWASKMSDLLSGLEAVGQVDASFTASVVELAGGYVDAGVDAIAVQAVRDSELTRQALWQKVERYSELYNKHISPLQGSEEVNDSVWVAALQAMASEFAVVAPE